ncbi:phosphatidate cytidylyltransferase [Cellulomonas endophytica]|uniref:phosphatidate cytidylyltransferase n=1 Tax=Cellulomonas endophytica TaxID=2494735 RepID=UPI0010103F72|nr:phosphatidate cytidylyltransferase [Cellulomonas endophytica]
MIDQPALAAPTSRRGRDLPLAAAVGVGLLVVVVVSLFVVKEGFALVVVAAVGTSLWELAQALRRRDIHLPLVPLLVGCLAMLGAAYAAGLEALLVALVATVAGCAAWRLADGGGRAALRDVTAATFAATWLPFLGGFAMLLLAAPDGAQRVLLFILLAVANDTGGYTAGVLVGRHPLAPSVSPKKTWEGLGGSVVLAVAVGVAGGWLLLGTHPLVGVVLGLAAVVSGTLGDLGESLLKRDLELKDMGRLVPGHGGLLDRLDSLLLTAPTTWAVLTLLVPVT